MQTEDIVEDVAIRNPCSLEQVLSIAEYLVEQTLFFNKGCREWKRKSAAEKPWKNWKTFLPQV